MDVSREWIRTYTGKRFWPLAPRIEDLDLVDIAHALSLKCRWGGHVPELYSVAQHSVHVAQLVAEPFKRWGLLHDAAEAYLPDLCTPIKARYPEVIAAEERILDLVRVRWSLPAGMPAEVKAADRRMMQAEALALMGFDASDLGLDPSDPSLHPIEPWAPRCAERLFLKAADELGIER